ncbi:MAG: hypothetical protein M1503_04805 [Thaumarchaeota archaeon]|nr:hypothetical protein [Nitrososphaerota archaeon]MCL5317571.1 hypothetical protein [Nitrososphaerota archaeon]
MVEIISKPLTQIAVHQIIRYQTPESLARTVVVQSSTGQPLSLSWIDGIVYRVLPPPFFISELLSKEYLEGKLHLSVLYAEMPTFKTTIHAAEENITIPVLNESDNTEAKALVTWLKKQKTK